MKSFLLGLTFALFTSIAVILPVKAQFQDINFSGNSASSFQCIDPRTGRITGATPFKNAATGKWECTGGYLASYKPPKLQQLEVWFVRIVYAIWALVASLSFLLLVYLGYQYLISQGDVTKITVIRKRIVNYIIGFALVFLAVPILTTTFRLMGINEEVDCYDEINMPAFQFFFRDLCTATSGSVAANCSSFGINAGDACLSGSPGVVCNNGGTVTSYSCIGSVWVLQVLTM